MKLFCLMIITVLFFGCSTKQKEDKVSRFNFVKSNNLSLPEPSGLSLTFNEDGFWTVSDENSTVYQLNRKGKVVRKFKVEGKNLEGITVIDEQTIAVVLEESRDVVILDTSGNELRRKKIELENETSLGLEGITFDRRSKTFYVLSEKNPGMLIRLNLLMNEIRRDTLNFAKDYSGIFFDEMNNLLWIVSDESKLVAKTDLNGNLIEKFDINIIQAEGICIDYKRNEMYAVSDRKEALYVYSLSSH